VDLRLHLTDVERALVDAVTRGQVLDLAGDDEVMDEAAMRCWDESRAIRAAVVRDILRGRLAPDPDPHGLRIRGARIIGRLDLENLTCGIAVELVECLLEEGIAATGAHLVALGVNGCRLEHPTAPPMDAERLTCAVGMSLARTTITADCQRGAVRLPGARLGQLDCSGATVRNGAGPALQAGGLHVDQHVLLLDGFQATGAGPDGAVRLTVARIGGYIDCTGATVRNDSGPAVAAGGLWMDRGLLLRGLDAVGTGADGAIKLAGAQVRRLDCTGATLRNDSGPALYAPRLQVSLDAVLTGGFTAAGGGDGVAVDLTGARVGATLAIDGAHLTHATDQHGRLALDGLTYSGLPVGVDPTDWLRLLREGTRAYAAQPYQQLAAGHRAAGHDGQARHVLMSQRADQIRRRALTSRPERTWARLTGLTLGYGYQPWRALLFLLAIVCTAVTLTLLLGAHGGLARNNPTATTTACSTVERIGVGLDIALPLVKTGTRGHLRNHHQRPRPSTRDRWMGTADPRLGIRHPVHRRLHHDHPQDLTQQGSHTSTTQRRHRVAGRARLRGRLRRTTDCRVLGRCGRCRRRCGGSPERRGSGS
jgi:hypothetical protein